ncbi:MAG: glycine--tRNA ligase [Patescibacteria group bacterium]
MSAKDISMDTIVALAKQRGFIYQSSEIYGGLGAVYDYGPLGILLKNNIQEAWWKSMIQNRDDVVGLDSAILMHQKVWEASGHVASFSDPLVDCKSCKRRHRADHLLEAKDVPADDKMTLDEINSLLKEHKVVCPDCEGELTPARDFNLMLETHIGPVKDDDAKIYLRPETAQGIYVNFKNVQQSSRKQIPFGIAQVGKAFRNEITTKQFVFRTREFSQMEMQFFVNPKDADAWYEDWKKWRMAWWEEYGISKDRLRFFEHIQLAHYAKGAYDIEYHFPWGWKEAEGLHNRGDFDLAQHEEYSGKDLKFTDSSNGEKYIPYIIETSMGLDRNVLTFLIEAYDEIEGGRSTTTESIKEKEVVMRFDKRIAPIKVAVLPLSKKEPLAEKAKGIATELRKHWMVQYDETGSIGKRYRRQDEIGTPYCVTVDFDSLEDNKVTVRDRDTMEQTRLSVDELMPFLLDSLA